VPGLASATPNTGTDNTTINATNMNLLMVSFLLLSLAVPVAGGLSSYFLHCFTDIVEWD
jgi:hypothetical protein